MIWIFYMSIKIISRLIFAGLYFRDFFPQAAKATTRFQTRPNFLSPLQNGQTRPNVPHGRKPAKYKAKGYLFLSSLGVSQC